MKTRKSNEEKVVAGNHEQYLWAMFLYYFFFLVVSLVLYLFIYLYRYSWTTPFIVMSISASWSKWDGPSLAKHLLFSF